MSESKLWAADSFEGDGGEGEEAGLELLVAGICEGSGMEGEGHDW